jgi:hypothetical protein
MINRMFNPIKTLLLVSGLNKRKLKYVIFFYPDRIKSIKIIIVSNLSLKFKYLIKYLINGYMNI